MIKLISNLSHLVLAGATGAVLGSAGEHWFQGGGLLVLVVFLVNHYYNIVPVVRKEYREEMSKLMSDYD